MHLGLALGVGNSEAYLIRAGRGSAGSAVFGAAIGCWSACNCCAAGASIGGSKATAAGADCAGADKFRCELSAIGGVASGPLGVDAAEVFSSACGVEYFKNQNRATSIMPNMKATSAKDL